MTVGPNKARWRLGVFGAALWGLGLVTALDRAYPPALERYEDVSTLVLDEDGGILRGFLSTDDKWRLPVSAEDVDPAYLDLLMAIEDQRFFTHPGVDPLAVARAGWQWLKAGRIVSGASTLTMQTARLLEPRPRTLKNKVIEMARALQLERHFDKRQILSIYLTLAPFGGNLEGVRAASLSYFDKEPQYLTRGQAALLVALPQSPESRRPDRHPTRALSARDAVLDRALTEGAVTDSQAKEAWEEAVPAQRLAFPFRAPHLARRLKNSNEEKVIQTSIDPSLQEALENFIGHEARWADDGASIAVVVVENETWNVKAYLGGADFWAPQGQLDLARAFRSPGSALKPFLYGLAFDDLTLHPQTLIEDRPMVFGDYAPQNFDKSYQGTVTIAEALRQSLNVPAVQVLDRIGPVRLASSLAQAGAQLSFAQIGAAPSLPLALGGVGIRLLDLTALYVGLANGGEMRRLRLTTQDEFISPRRIFSRAAAWYVTDILKGSAMPDGWAPRAGIDGKRPIAFKTGTSYGFRDAWSVGYSGAYTVGVWVGRADGSARPGHFGRNTAAPLLLNVFGLLPVERRVFPAPPDNIISVNDRRNLPLAMRVFKPRTRKASYNARQTDTPAPVIKFPGNGVSVALPGEGEDSALALKAVGGALPLRWMVNNELLPPASFLDTTFWRPAGLGYADIMVVDAYGRSARSHVRLIAPR